MEDYTADGGGYQHQEDYYGEYSDVKTKDKFTKGDKQEKIKAGKMDKHKADKTKDKTFADDAIDGKWKKKVKGVKDKQDKEFGAEGVKEVRKPKKKKLKHVSWSKYIAKVLKTVHKDDCSMSQAAMAIMDSFAHDLFERISNEAVKLLRLSNKRTLTSLEIQTAAKLVLPGELCTHAIQDGAKAVSKYTIHQKKASGTI